MGEQAYFYGTGKRKSAIAQGRIMSGSGAIIVNGKPFDEIFGMRRLQAVICQPLKVTNTLDGLNVVVKVSGGGVASQAGAICHGVSRALLRMDENFRQQLRSCGLLTRDARVKERQKYGLRRARKARQYRKR